MEIIIRKTKNNNFVVVFPYEIHDEDGECLIVTKKGHSFEMYETIMQRTFPFDLTEDSKQQLLSYLYFNYGYQNLEIIPERDYELYLKRWTKEILDENKIRAGSLLKENNYWKQLKGLDILDDDLILKILYPISSDFDLFLDRYNRDQFSHNQKMTYIIKKIMLEAKFPYIKLFQDFMNISDELKDNGLIVGDIDNSRNWGFKNNHLAIFDIGYGKDWSHVEDLETITEVDKSVEPVMTYDKIRSLAKKMGVQIVKYLGGQNYGYAYETTDNKVLKLTADQTEARNCLKIMGKKMEYIANVYEVYKYLLEGQAYYLILLEKLNTDGIEPVIEKYNEIDNFLYNLWIVVNRKRKEKEAIADREKRNKKA